MIICGACGGSMKIIANIENLIVIGIIVSHLQATSCGPEEEHDYGTDQPGRVNADITIGSKYQVHHPSFHLQIDKTDMLALSNYLK